MHPMIYLTLELATVALFGLTLWHAWRRGASAVAELLTAAAYGVLLEWGDIVIFKTYEYAPGFWLAIGPVPIVIGLCWGLIIYGAMAYSDQLGLVAWAAPFADAVWAIVLDLAFDAVAIRLRFWTWTTPLELGYFGVPADNFFAWLFVALSFSAYARAIRALGVQGWRWVALQLAAPVVAFAGLLGGIAIFNVTAALVYPAGVPIGGGMPIFAATLAIFAGIVGLGIARRGVPVRAGIDVIPVLTRWAMHGYFLLWAVLLALVPALRLPGTDMPAFLIWVALALLAVEVLLLVPMVQRRAAFRRQFIVAPQPQMRIVASRRRELAER